MSDGMLTVVYIFMFNVILWCHGGFRWNRDVDRNVYAWKGYTSKILIMILWLLVNSQIQQICQYLWGIWFTQQIYKQWEKYIQCGNCRPFLNNKYIILSQFTFFFRFLSCPHFFCSFPPLSYTSFLLCLVQNPGPSSITESQVAIM